MRKNSFNLFAAALLLAGCGSLAGFAGTDLKLADLMHPMIAA